MDSKSIMLVLLLSFTCGIAHAGTWSRKVSEFPDGATRDAVVAEMESCGITGAAAHLLFLDVKVHAAFHSKTAIQAIGDLCAIRRVMFPELLMMVDQDVWESQLDYTP